MEEGILFLKAEKAPLEYQKSFCFAGTQRSAFWDGEAHAEVTHEEALYYDAVMEKIVSAQFF